MCGIYSIRAEISSTY